MWAGDERDVSVCPQEVLKAVGSLEHREMSAQADHGKVPRQRGSGGWYWRKATTAIAT